MYREVTMIEVREVLRLRGEGLPKKRIAAQLGLDPKTVRRYLTAAAVAGVRVTALISDEEVRQVLLALHPAGGRPRGDGWARCLEQRVAIERWLGDGLRLTKIRKLLVRHGIEIAYPTLHRFAVLELQFGKTATTIPVLDGEPGHELQLDTGWVGWLTLPQGKKRRFRAWIFTAVRSRHRFVYPTFEETTVRAIEACEAAWDFFGGIFRVLIPDNTKAIISEADALAPRITPAFLEYAQARRFHIDPARVRHARDKWRDEMLAEWNMRASRPGDLAVMSARYPSAVLATESQRYVKNVLAFIGNDTEGRDVVEVGCGTGRLSKHLVTRCDKLTCLDISEKMLLRNREQLGAQARVVSYHTGFCQDYRPLRQHDVAIVSLVLIHNITARAFQELAQAISACASTVFLFEHIGRLERSTAATRTRSEAEILAAFHGFEAERRDDYALFDDQLIFLKLVRAA